MRDSAKQESQNELSQCKIPNNFTGNRFRKWLRTKRQSTSGCARIDSGSFSEKDVIAKTTFDQRPSAANDQKRLFKQEMDSFVSDVKRGSPHTDISGGVLQAVEYLNETGARNKSVLIFSDLEEDLPKGHIRNFPIELNDIHVVALNVTKLRTDNIDPRDYLNRLDLWQQKVVSGGGDWRVINDFERLEKLVLGRS